MSSIEVTIMGDGFQGTRLGTSCACGGEMWCVGRYGWQRFGDNHVTLLTSATNDEIRELSRRLEILAQRANLTIEDIADELAAQGSPLATRLAAWVRDNGGSIALATLVIDLLALCVYLLNQPEPAPPPPDITIYKIDVEPANEPPANTR